MAARVLVAHASKLGSTAEIARTIGDVLAAAGHAVEVLPVRDVRSLADYDAVILGSALYAAHWQSSAGKFLNRFRTPLAALPLWAFSSGPLDHRLAGQNLPICAHALELLGTLAVRDHRTFGGKLASDAPVDPQVLKTHPIGDFRNWAAIHDWAVAVGRDLTAL